MDTTSETDDIENILGPDEKLLIFAEEKIYHPDIDVDTLAMTNERIILRQPHAPGTKADFTDIRYSEIEGVELARGRRRLTIKLTFRDGRDPLELGFPLSPLAEQARGIIGANLNLQPAAESAESSPAEPSPSEAEETVKVPEEAPAPEENALPEEEGMAEVAEEEKEAPAAEAKPKRRTARRRSVPANKVKSAEEEDVQYVAPAPETMEVQAPEEIGPDKADIPEEPEEIEIAQKEEIVESPIPSTEDGWIEINGKRYEYDVIVHTDGSVSKRDKSLSRAKKAKYGHTPLTGKEVKLLLKESPDVIIIGIGQTGALPITPKAQKMLEVVPCLIGPTPQALGWLTEEKRRAVALFHVTC